MIVHLKTIAERIAAREPYYSEAEKALLKESSSIPYVLEPGFWENYFLRVMFVSAEHSPTGNRAGGLADVAGNLPLALAKKGVKVEVVIPGHWSARKWLLDSPGPIEDNSMYLRRYLNKNSTWRSTLFAQQARTPLVLRGKEEERLPAEIRPYLTYTLISDEEEYYFGDSKNQCLYVGANPDDGPGDAERFLYFSLMAAAWSEMKEQNGSPTHINHINDWSSGAIPFFEKILNGKLNTPTMFSLHNIYSGNLDMAYFNRLFGGNRDYDFIFDPLHRAGFQVNDRIDLLAAGLKWSDIVMTVSSQYHKELVNNPEFSKDYFPIIRMLEDEGIFDGIINGYNPDFEINEVMKDEYDWQGGEIKETEDLLVARKFMKNHLQKELNLTVDPNAMVFGFINRWDNQKSYRETIEVMRRLMSLEQGRNIQFIATGLNNKQKEESSLFLELKRQFSGRVAIEPYSDALARRINVALDSLDMPSKYEPAGISQNNGKAVGTPTVANDTGGLHNTITDGQTGYLFNGFSADGKLLEFDKFVAAFEKASLRAMADFQHPERWNKIVETTYADRKKYTWDAVADNYLYWYGYIIARRMLQAYILQNGNPREHLFSPEWLLPRRRH